MSNFGPLTQLSDGLALQFRSMEPVGADVRLIARVVGRDIF
jgi:diaminohydroxyphosphoribosylaminopyrimidine deaminase/5-amino-6-(5-phosphoribosylamino)uracil reductase